MIVRVREIAWDEQRVRVRISESPAKDQTFATCGELCMSPQAWSLLGTLVTDKVFTMEVADTGEAHEIEVIRL